MIRNPGNHSDRNVSQMRHIVDGDFLLFVFANLDLSFRGLFHKLWYHYNGKICICTDLLQIKCNKVDKI